MPRPIPRQLELQFDAPVAPQAGDAASGLLARLRALGLRGIRYCTLTSNRSTMVSFRSERLRVQRAFADAPVAVLRAVVEFVNGTRAVRRRARHVLVGFRPALPPAPARPRRRRPERVHPEDEARIARLVAEHRRLNTAYFDGTLRPVAIRLSRHMRSRLGHYAPGTPGTAPEIAIGFRHLRRDGWRGAFETLAHEMVHQWQHETGRPIAHDRDFRMKTRAIGITPRARRSLELERSPEG